MDVQTGKRYFVKTKHNGVWIEFIGLAVDDGQGGHEFKLVRTVRNVPASVVREGRYIRIIAGLTTVMREVM